MKTKIIILFSFVMQFNLAKAQLGATCDSALNLTTTGGGGIYLG